MILSVSPYRRVLSSPGVPSVLVLGFLVRVPVFSAAILITVHVVSTLHHSYSAAGVVSALSTLALAISAPWRGRVLDRRGLRRTLVPSLVVLAGCWSVAPFVGYLPLAVLVTVAGLFMVPVFSIVRQALISAVGEGDRRTAISLDSMVIELSAMAGPPVAIWASTQWGTARTLLVTQLLGVACGLLLMAVNPRLRMPEQEDALEAVPRRAWMGAPFVAVCLTAVATTLVLGGTELGLVAAMRDFDRADGLGWLFTVWAAGSLLGGLVYGALHRPISAFWLLGALAVVTLPLALAGGPVSLAAVSFVAGLLCAPTITATVDQMSRVVPAASLGEAMGWHGSAITGGMALGAPLAGMVIDRAGVGAGFVAVAAVGGVVAVAGLVLRGSRSRASAVPAVGGHR